MHQLTFNIPMNNTCIMNPPDCFRYFSKNWYNPLLLETPWGCGFHLVSVKLCPDLRRLRSHFKDRGATDQCRNTTSSAVLGYHPHRVSDR